MKCQSCGAETKEKVCEFCGSEMPQEKASVNITNNYYSNVSQQNADGGKCPKCGSGKITFEREKVATATQSTTRKNAIGNGRKGEAISQSAYRTIGLCQSCGYTWNPNSGSNSSAKKGAPMWLWVLGWICIFPIPLTILFLRKKEMKPALKYGIIAAAWIIYLIIGLSGNGENTENVNETPSQIESVQEVQPAEELQEEATESVQETETIDTAENEENVNGIDSYIDGIVGKYNAQVSEQLVFVESFTPSDKSSSHYRTEFRLGAYEDAVGKSYLLGDKVVDLVASETMFGDINFRVYTRDTSLEQVVALIKGMSPLMDETLSATDLDETVKEVEAKKTANGYYYGELGITLFGSDDKGYELMIKND